MISLDSFCAIQVHGHAPTAQYSHASVRQGGAFACFYTVDGKLQSLLVKLGEGATPDPAFRVRWADGTVTEPLRAEY